MNTFTTLKKSLIRTGSLAGKELYSALYSPVTYGIGVFFLLFVSIWFFFLQRFFANNLASLRSFFGTFPLAFIFVIPTLTMKSWAEERKTGTVELLLTMPFSEWELVGAKFLAALAQAALFITLTAAVPLSLSLLGAFEGGVIFTEYAGALLLAACAVSLGILLSSLAKNQAGAFLGSAVVLMAVMLINQVPLLVTLPDAIVNVINYLSLSFHFESFSRGLLDSRDLAFFIISTFLFLYLNTQALVYRKWK
ncbi:MAG: ABC transporter permease [Treponema sp.]|nr:ABC transporter permease [Treponema sp.]